MDDRELADAVVALGTGYLHSKEPNRIFAIHGWDSPRMEHQFVRDWRVAGELLEAKCWGCNLIRKGDEWEAHVVPIGRIKEYIARTEHPVRAICEAVVEAYRD